LDAPKAGDRDNAQALLTATTNKSFSRKGAKAQRGIWL